jgi:multicomponent Na+:H+ antiporter subunit D
MKPTPEDTGKPSPPAARILVVALAALVVLLGLWPEPLVYLSEQSAAVLTGGSG